MTEFMFGVVKILEIVVVAQGHAASHSRAGIPKARITGLLSPCPAFFSMSPLLGRLGTRERAEGKAGDLLTCSRNYSACTKPSETLLLFPSTTLRTSLHTPLFGMPVHALLPLIWNSDQGGQHYFYF